jgi:hypothetical protein
MSSQQESVSTDIPADIGICDSEQSELTASALIQQWEGFIADTIRRMLHYRHARKLCDEDDLRQSVCVALLIATRRRRIHADCPQQIAALIAQIASNQVNAAMRAAFAECRDVRRTQQLDSSNARKVPDPGCDPAGAVEQEELQQVMLNRLDDTGRRIVFKLSLGRTWAEIAAEEPDKPSADAIRKMFMRHLRPMIGNFIRADAG